MKFDLKHQEPKDIQKILSEAYMNINFDNQQLYNPLEEIPESIEDKPELFITYMLSQPEFLTFTCKYVLGVDIIPLQAVILRELWIRKFPMLVGARGLSKSFMLGILVILLMLLKENRKIIICGASFRQSKIIFGYAESIINNSSILRSIFTSECFTHGNDNHSILLGNSICRAIPLGTGDRIRGLRSTNTIADEFSSIFIDIFETVIAGFGSVSASPAENVRNIAKQKLAVKLGIELDETELKLGKSDNQMIIAGTAHYDFNHFSRYHKRWLQIIKSRGDSQKLRDILGESFNEKDGLDWKDFSVIRIPVDIIPDGFMDMAQISRSKATMTKSNYSMEYGASFVCESDGFFKNTLILQCTVNYDTKIKLPSGRILDESESFFEPELFGDLNAEYIYGIDTASKQDNFSIVILKDCGEYRKLVQVWVTNEKDHREKVKLRLSNEHNFYSFVVRKIRDLMKVFPCKRMAIDSQGGGIAVMESLRDRTTLKHNEQPILPIVIPGKPQDTDGESGLQIIEPINFVSQNWTSQANHGMKKDLEDRILLFPYIDTVSIALAQAEDEHSSQDEFQQLLFNIEELKLEMISINVTETATGREHFDTPEIKTGTGRKGRMKKDRYSALLMANACARNMNANFFTPLESTSGGFASGLKKTDVENEPCYQGPNWIVSKLQNLYD